MTREEMLLNLAEVRREIAATLSEPRPRAWGVTTEADLGAEEQLHELRELERAYLTELEGMPLYRPALECLCSLGASGRG